MLQAITVHARTVQDRRTDRARWADLRVVVEALADTGVPVIVNGDAFTRASGEQSLVETGAASVMVARGALVNAHEVFTAPQSAGGEGGGGEGAPEASAAAAAAAAKSLDEVMRDYLRLAIETDAHPINCKYSFRSLYKSRLPLRPRINARGGISPRRVAISRARLHAPSFSTGHGRRVMHVGDAIR